MKWKPSQNAGENAKARLPKLVQEYFRAGRKAVKQGKTAKQLHRFRVETKQFRYALELFRPIYGPPLDRHIKALRGIQDALGKVSDYQSIQEMIAGDKKLESEVEQAQAKKIKKFRQEWKRFDSDGQLKRWKAYFGRVQSSSRAAKAPAKQRTPLLRQRESSSSDGKPMLE